MQESVNVILFDFDGTIADSLATGIQIINQLADEFGYRQLDLQEIKRLKDLSSREIIKQSEVSILKLPFLVRRFVTEMNREMQSLQMVPGVKDALLTLSDRGDRLGIVSTNSRENVKTFLKAHALDSLFEFIVCSTKPFGKSRLIQRIIRQNNLDSRSVFYVGDETRDIEAARKGNVSAIAVSWGFNSRQALAKHAPDFLVENPHELVKVISKSSL